MEDFRNKIKNYKATANDQAWERMLIKKEKRKIKKTKMFLLALLGLNIAAFIFWSLQTWNINTKNESNIKETKNIEANIARIESKENQSKSLEIKFLNDQNDSNQEKITSLLAENNKLKNQIQQLKRTVEHKQFKISQLANQKQNALFTSSLHASSISKIDGESSQKIEELETVSFNSTKILPLPTNRINFLQKYLLEMAGNMKPSIPYFYNETIINNTPIKKWYLSIGTNYENLVEDSQRSLVTGLHRSLNKHFDLGVILEFSKIQERGVYRINNDVKDHTTETIGQLIVRYKAVRFRKFLLHADAGIGYRFGSISNRNSKVVDNLLTYYNESSNYNGIDYHFALGAMYQITPQFNLGTRFYLDRNLHTNINLNYRF